VTDARKPYPLSWEEQTRLFKELPPHLARMALFKVNTGTREKEVCYLRREWEAPHPLQQSNLLNKSRLFCPTLFAYMAFNALICGCLDTFIGQQTLPKTV